MILKNLFKFLFGFIVLSLAAAVLTTSLPLPGTIPVLMYHSVGSKDDAKERKHFVSRESFGAQMAFLRLFSFRVISMDQYARILKGEQKSRGREIVITFDDANETFMQEVWPVLRKYAYPVTLFTVSESLKRQMNGSMTPEDFKEVLSSERVTVGANSKTHPALDEIEDEAQLLDEVKGSKEDLEKELKVKVNYFSYPNGDLDARALKAVSDSGYRLGFTTSYHKLRRLEETPFSLTRLNITRSSDNPLIFWTKVTGIYQTHKAYWQKLKNFIR